LYFFDAYAYLNKAIMLANNGELSFSVGFPFILVLGSSIKILNPIIGAIEASRISTIGCSLLLIYILYRFGEIIAGKTFGIIAASLAAFEAYFISFSIVPHNDIFAITFGLLTLWFARSSSKYRFLYCPFLFFITVLTRPEFYAVFLIPLIVLLIHKEKKNGPKKQIALTSYVFLIYILPFAVVYTNIIGSYTRFGLLERFSLFPIPELLINTVQNVLTFSGNFFANLVCMALLTVSVFMLILNLVKIVRKRETRRKIPNELKINTLENKKTIFWSCEPWLTLSFLILFIIDILVLTVYAYSYRIINDAIQVSFILAPRYMILPQLILAYILAYPLSRLIPER